MRKEKKKIAEVKIIAEPVEAAEEAGLRYVSENQAGYTRKAKSDDFEYLAMHESANSTFITSVGAKCAMQTNTNELFHLGKRCRKSAEV
jgi:hypothetical protein